MPNNCIGCGEPVTTLHWNSSCDALVCDNSSCRLFRQPIPAPKGGTPTLAEELGGAYSRHKGHPRRKHAAFTLEERLQELRDEISA